MIFYEDMNRQLRDKARGQLAVALVILGYPVLSEEISLSSPSIYAQKLFRTILAVDALTEGQRKVAEGALRVAEIMEM